MLFIHGVGRLGRDPEIGTFEGQKGPVKTARFSVGFDRPFGDEVDWFNCQVNGKRADVIEQYFHKGSEIEIFGRPESYKGNRDNAIHWTIRVIDFGFTGGTNQSRDAASPKPAAAQTAPAEPQHADTFEDIDEDVPF